MPHITRTTSVPWAKKPKPFEGMKPHDDFYNSKSWRRFRHGYIARHPLCLHCHMIGIVTPSKVADHITPIADGGAKFDEANIQPLCSSCHNRKSVNQRYEQHG